MAGHYAGGALMSMACPECATSPDACNCPASIRPQPAHTWTLTIEGLIPMSMNQRERCSHWKRHRELGELTTHLKHLAAEQCIPAATTRRSVQVTIHKTTRSRVKDDPANRDSRAKSILDALTTLGLLIDDNDRYLDWQGVIEGERRSTLATVVTITDTGSAAA